MVEVVCLDVSQLEANDYNHLYCKASSERRARADRYLRQEDKLRCVVVDNLLRYVVNKALNMDAYVVAVDEMGKPYLKDVDGFHYNLSHSGRWVVIAYGTTPVGVDVQEVRGSSEQEIARRFYTSDEQDYVFGGAERERMKRFYRVWTSKESYLKYLGTGIRKPLDSFSVLDDLNVQFHTAYLENACMTVCAVGDVSSITILDVNELR